MKTESEILAAVATEIFLTLCDHEDMICGGIASDESLEIALDLVCDAIDQIEKL